MKAAGVVAVLCAVVVSAGLSVAWADDLPQNATFSTLIKTPRVIEGLTGDNAGNLYTVGRNPGNGVACPVWRINLASPSLEVIGTIPAPSLTTQCSPSGLAFNDIGHLFVADGDKIFTFTPNATTPPIATVFASGVPGTNGLAFDRDGNLWTGDGTTGQGRVWKITPAGVVTEEFRIQPMANVLNPVVSSGVSNVGRDNRTLPPGTIDAARAATNTAGSQPLVANGLAFNDEGDQLFIADTARGAIWRVKFNHDGTLKDGQIGCDTTFTANTLCLKNIFVAHPFLEGTDGIALDKEGNIWNSANERNAIVVVTEDKKVVEVFRNAPDGTTHLRNTGPLEFPASPFLSGKKFCTSSSDGNRRDNSPNTAGEIKPAGPDRGKISCMDQDLEIPGQPLPVR